ncbi:MAG: hypothetical protein ACI9IP_003192 [Arcticibacterium sp.]|jgi:hypothetical protein
MKPKVLKTLAVFMSLNIVFSAAGFIVFEHTCHVMGVISSSLSEKELCYTEAASEVIEAEGPYFYQGACCEEKSEHKYLSLETSTGFEKIDFPNVVLALRDFSFNENRPIESIAFNSICFEKLPPPAISAKQIRLKTQSFRI